MAKKQTDFTSIGKKSGTIPVRLSYKIVELFSEGLYASPNKAIEELVSNSFDAGARHVQVVLSPDLHAEGSTIAVIDDGEGMDAVGLRRHWFIGDSNKRSLTRSPLDRQQIGKFGIGKLATYVLAGKFTHVTKVGEKFFATSMNYSAITPKGGNQVEPKKAIQIPLRVLSETQARDILSPWSAGSPIKLFGKGASPSWTVAIMSALKPKVHDIRPGTLEWVLRTALPLRPDFEIWLGREKLLSSKAGKGLIKSWKIGRDIKKLPKPAPSRVEISVDKSSPTNSEQRYGLAIAGLGRITGYVEAYKDLLTGKSDEISRSNGFFVYVRGRLVNVSDGHFGISPDELRHGTFGRFRAVVHIDALDRLLRSNREALSEDAMLGTAQNVLRALFNFARSEIEQHDAGDTVGARIARRIADSPAGLVRGPVVELVKAVFEKKATSRYLIIPTFSGVNERSVFVEDLNKRALTGVAFLNGSEIDFTGSTNDGIARFDVEAGILKINALHPFVAVFYDDFTKKSAEPLELLAMAEVLSEAQMHALGTQSDIRAIPIKKRGSSSDIGLILRLAGNFSPWRRPYQEFAIRS